MDAVLTKEPETVHGKLQAHPPTIVFAEIRKWPLDRMALTLALAAVPISIAASEILLTVGLLARVVRCIRQRWSISLPWVFRIWLVFAGLVTVTWLLSPDMAAGWSEIRRLVLVASLFFAIPSLASPGVRLTAWKAVFLTSGIASVFLIGDFVGRLFHYHRELAVGGPAALYLRTGGLLNHWMVFATVEILVVAGLIAFWSCYPEHRKRWAPLFVLNGIAVALSLTRTAWLVCFLLAVFELIRRRSRWAWLTPILPVLFAFMAPGPVRSRIKESMSPDYYSNQERLQMLRVGWDLIREKPLTGVGAGRIDKVYRQHLRPGEPVPAYHGHLHNNLVQMAATQGIPVAMAAVLLAASMLGCLFLLERRAGSREVQFESRAGTLGLIGFSLAGLFDYTYGHSLALILLGFAVIGPLVPDSQGHQVHKPGILN